MLVKVLFLGIDANILGFFREWKFVYCHGLLRRRYVLFSYSVYHMGHWGVSFKNRAPLLLNAFGRCLVATGCLFLSWHAVDIM